MKSIFLRSLILSMGLTASAYASAPAPVMTEEQRAIVMKVMSTSYLESPSQCSTCPAGLQAGDVEGCFSAKVEKSFKLDNRLTNLLLCPDFLVPLELKRDVLEKIAPVDVNNNNNAIAKTDEQVIAEFAQKRTEAMKAVGYDRLVTFIFDPTRLTEFQAASVLRKMAWAGAAYQSPVDPELMDKMICALGGGQFKSIPKDVRKIVFAHLDIASFASMAMVQKATMEVAKDHLYVMLNSIHYSIRQNHHPASGNAPLFNHLGYLIFAMKAYGHEDDEQGDRVDWPLCLLNAQMERYRGHGRIDSGTLLMLALLKGSAKAQGLEELLEPAIQIAMILHEGIADWELCSKLVKKETDFNGPGQTVEDSDSDEDEGCVIA